MNTFVLFMWQRTHFNALFVKKSLSQDGKGKFTLLKFIVEKTCYNAAFVEKDFNATHNLKNILLCMKKNLNVILVTEHLETKNFWNSIFCHLI